MLTKSNEKDLDMECQNEEPNYSLSLQKLEQVECYADIIFYLKHGTCPNHFVGHGRRSLRLKASKYVITQMGLGWKNLDGLILRCVDEDEVKSIINEFHVGICGGHYATRTTNHKILKVGYYWPSIFYEVHKFVRCCEPCQLFPGKQKLASLHLHLVVVEAPFQ